MKNLFQNTGGTLMENDYPLVPITPGTKQPSIKGWQNASLSAADLPDYPGHGIGVLCGQGAYPVCAVDIDVSHHVIGPLIRDWCLEHMGAAPERVGAAPRTMLVYRADADGWRKRQSRSFTDANDLTKLDGKVNQQKVEVLGNGQQFVAYGTHPDTHKPYEWIDLMGGLEWFPAVDLQVVTKGQIDALLAFVNELLSEAPGIDVEGTDQSGQSVDSDAEWLLRQTPKMGLTPEQGLSAVQCIDNTKGVDYDNYLSVGMALHHESDGAQWGLDTWVKWAMQSAKFKKGDAERRWRSFGKNAKTLTMAWVLRNAQNLPPALAQIAYLDLIDQTDAGNANLLHRLTRGDLIFTHEQNCFFFWDGGKWIKDESRAIAQREALRVGAYYLDKSEHFKRQADNPELDKADQKRLLKIADSLKGFATKCRNKRALDSMLALFSRDPRASVSSAQFDRNPWLLGVNNGVVDLRTGELREAARDEYVTKRSRYDYDPRAAAPAWERFIVEVMGSPIDAQHDPVTGAVIPASVGKFTPRVALATYLQKALGYSITGETREHKMFIAVGAGGNGKNVLLDIMQDIASDYWRTIPPEALMATRGDADAERPSPTVASLAGARAAISSESRDGHKLDVATVKRHTGGGTMTGRFMRENQITFDITHKLWLMTNHLPSLDNLDEALRGRLHLIPFDRVWNRPGHTARNPALPDGDKNLMAKLKGESAGILAWLVRGAVMYQRDGLEPPSVVTAMTHDYFQGADAIGQWLDVYEVCDPDTGTGVRELHSNFRSWCVINDFKDEKTEKAFSMALVARGVRKSPRKTSGFLFGIRKTKGEKESVPDVSHLF